MLALWSGTRALNVFIDTITVMHGLGGHRGIIRTRALSFLLYILALVTGIAAIPLMRGRPALVGGLRCPTARLPAAVLLARGRRDLHLLPGDALPPVGPGADQLALQPARARCSRCSPGSWGRYLLRWMLTVTAADSRSIYGPLAAPIAILLWLYLVAIAVLIGAAVNASFDTVFPQKATTRARAASAAAVWTSASVSQASDEAGRGPPVAARSPFPTAAGPRGGSSAGACWPRWGSWSAR